MTDLTQVRRDPKTGYWSLYVHGQRVIHEESYAVVHGVQAALRGQGGVVGELSEVAKALRPLVGL